MSRVHCAHRRWKWTSKIETSKCSFLAASRLGGDESEVDCEWMGVSGGVDLGIGSGGSGRGWIVGFLGR